MCNDIIAGKFKTIIECHDVEGKPEWHSAIGNAAIASQGGRPSSPPKTAGLTRIDWKHDKRHPAPVEPQESRTILHSLSAQWHAACRCSPLAGRSATCRTRP